MKSAFWLLLLSFLPILLLSGCAGPSIPQVTPSRILFQPSQTNAPTESSSPTLENTKTQTSQPQIVLQSKTPSPLPSTTPEYLQPGIGVKEKGPYFFYSRQLADIYDSDERDSPTILVAVDEDASGQVVFTLPNNGHIRSLSQSISKDGEWVAYYAGSPEKFDQDEHYDFSLHLYQWKTGMDIKVADLLSKDYPQNFEKTADFLRNSGPSWYKDIWKLENELQSFFKSHIYNLAWSPDGRYLAFSSEQDGPSSDVYLYGLHTGEIRRLTDGPAYVEWMLWTPDSQKIFHYSAYNGCQGECGTYHVVDLSGKAWDLQIDSYGGINIFAGWVSDNQMAMYSHANGSRGPLRYVNIDTGEDRIIMNYGVENGSYNKKSNQWLIELSPDFDDVFTHGWYLFDLGSNSLQPLDLSKYENAFFPCSFVSYDDPSTPFILICERKAVYLVHRDGSLTTPIDGEVNITNWEALSPDNQWFLTTAFSGQNQPSTRSNSNSWFLFYTADEDGKWSLEKTISGTDPNLFFWRPDSKGFFYKAAYCPGQSFSDCLFYYDLETQQISLVDNQVERLSSQYDNWYAIWRP